MRKSKLGLLIATALCCAMSPMAVASAQSSAAAASLPSAESVLSHYQQFLGGAEALARITTREVVTRRLELSATPADETLYRTSARPMLSIMHHEAQDGSFVRYTNGCDADGGWVGYGPGEAGVPRPGEASTDGVCEQEQYFYGYLPLDLERFKKNVGAFEVRGVTSIVLAAVGAAGELAGGEGADLVPGSVRQVYLVLATPARPNDNFTWLYFDTATGALLRRAEGGKAADPVQPGKSLRYTDFLQYREVGDGTRAPYQFVTIAPSSEVRGIMMRVTDNGTIDPSVFVRPKDIRRADKGL